MTFGLISARVSFRGINKGGVHMEYRAVGNRCAVILSELGLPISDEEALAILIQKGFRVIEVDLIALARGCIGISSHRRGAALHEAPGVVDCSSFGKWLYAQRGIWLPRRSIQQRELGVSTSPGDIVRGDLVFASGYISYYYDNPLDGVGHAGIATGDGTVIQALNKDKGVIESSLDAFIDRVGFRGVRRYIPQDVEVLTLETPPHRGVETSDDLRWIILQSLPKIVE